MDWPLYFSTLEDWKRFPAYKMEPRIDSIVAYYLMDFAGERLRKKIVACIPELPIRLGTVKPKLEGTVYSDRSYKVDFYLLAEDGQNLFVEFKSDTGSRREGQDTYLSQSKQMGMRKIVDGIVGIAKVSKYKDKYGHLLDRLMEIGLLDRDLRFVGNSDLIEVVYVQPKAKTDDEVVIDFNWIAGWLEDSHKGKGFETALAKSLRAWAND